MKIGFTILVMALLFAINEPFMFGYNTSPQSVVEWIYDIGVIILVIMGSFYLFRGLSRNLKKYFPK
jgi:Na+-driven multidrug efflux pump